MPMMALWVNKVIFTVWAADYMRRRVPCDPFELNSRADGTRVNLSAHPEFFPFNGNTLLRLRLT
jgi:hypothetical protein